MTAPELRLATVTHKDGRQFYGAVLQDHLSTQIHHVPHDPDVESPLWLANYDVDKIEWEGATP